MLKKLIVILGIFVFSTLLYAETLTVVTEEQPPYNYSNSEGEAIGACTAIVKEALKRANLNAEIKVYPWSKAYNMALEEKNVLIYSIIRSKKREPLFKWIEASLLSTQYDFLKLKERDDIKMSSIEDGKNYTIGVVNEDIGAQNLEEKGFQNLDKSQEFNTCVEKLFSKKVDMIVVDKNCFTFESKRKGFDLKKVESVWVNKDISKKQYIAASRKTSDDVVKKIEKEINIMKKTGTYYALLSKWVDWEKKAELR